MDAEAYNYAKIYTEKKYLKPAYVEALKAMKRIKRIQGKEKQTKADKAKIEQLKVVLDIYKLWKEYVACLEALKVGSNDVSKLRGMKAPLILVPRRYKELTKKDFPKIMRKFKNAYYKKKSAEVREREKE